MYFQWANGSFTDVQQVGGGLIYYLPRNHSSDTTKVQAFPDGLRILTGNPFLRSYSGNAMAQAIGWNCLGAPVTETRQPYLPPYNCPNGLRAEIRFPSCWSGSAVDVSLVQCFLSRSALTLVFAVSLPTTSRTWPTPSAASQVLALLPILSVS